MTRTHYRLKLQLNCSTSPQRSTAGGAPLAPHCRRALRPEPQHHAQHVLDVEARDVAHTAPRRVDQQHRVGAQLARRGKHARPASTYMPLLTS